jgi:hypothetical protein
MRRLLHPWSFAAKVLAPLLAFLLVAASLAPCTALAGIDTAAGAAASSDPCKPRKATSPPAGCIQLACQSATVLAPTCELAEPVAFESVVYCAPVFRLEGRRDAPEPPPPKSAPATRD